MKSIFIILSIILGLGLHVNNLYSQETDKNTLVYKLTNTHIDQYYSKIKQQIGNKEIDENYQFRDTTFTIYFDKKIVSVSKYTDELSEYGWLIIDKVV